MVTSAPPLPALCAVVAGLTRDDLPSGYRCINPEPAAAAAPEGVCGRAALRWLPPAGAPPAEPLAVDVTLTAYERRTGALRALTSPPALPDGLQVKPLFAPRIGDEAAALRADVTEADTHYVLYRVDIQVGRWLGTVAATWRWPAGSPNWVYERARRLAGRLTNAG